MRLLLPEWQGYGLSAAPAEGARELAAALFADRDVTTIDAPADEALGVTDGVLGLDSIAPRFTRALNVIRAAAPDRIAMIGATCGVELAPIAYLNERHAGDLAVLWLDGHADLNTPASSPSGHFHGMVLRTLLGDGPAPLAQQISRPLEARQVFLVGARDFDPPEREFIQRAGIAAFDTAIFDYPGRLMDAIRAAGLKHVYVHLDVDVFNPDDFPAALMRTPGGPLLNDITGLLMAAHYCFTIAGFSVVEYCGGTRETRDRLVEALSPVIGWFVQTC